MVLSNRDRAPKASLTQAPRSQMPTAAGHRMAAARGEQQQIPNRAPQQFHPSVSNSISNSAAQANAPNDTKAPSVAAIFEILQGTHPSSLIDDIISTAQSNLVQLKATHDHLLTTPIGSKDRDKIIKALQPQTLTQQEVIAHITAAHDAGFKAAQRVAMTIYADEIRREVENARSQGYRLGVQAVRQQHVNKLAEFQRVGAARSAVFAKYINDTEENMRISATQHADFSFRLEQSSTELELLSRHVEQSSMELKHKSAQLERCKNLFRDMIRARDAGDKHRLVALVAEADLAEWLGLDNGNEDEMRD